MDDEMLNNYVCSSYIAEFYNTISNIPAIILAVIGLIIALSQGFEKRFTVLHLSNMILAMGSILFHGTLQRVQQQSDETPMVGKCSFISTFCTHLIGITEAQCPHSSSSMVLFLPLFIQYFISRSVLKLIMLCSASFASLGCTNTTSTQRILQPSVLQSFM